MLIVVHLHHISGSLIVISYTMGFRNSRNSDNSTGGHTFPDSALSQASMDSLSAFHCHHGNWYSSLHISLLLYINPLSIILLT